MIRTFAPRVGPGCRVFDFGFTGDHPNNSGFAGSNLPHDICGNAPHGGQTTTPSTSQLSRYGGIGVYSDASLTAYAWFNPATCFNLDGDEFTVSALANWNSSGNRGFLCGQATNTGANGTISIGVNTSNQWTAQVFKSDSTSISWTGPTRDTSRIQRIDLVRRGSLIGFAIDGAFVSWQTISLPVRINGTNKFGIGSSGENIATRGGAYGVLWYGFIERFVILRNTALYAGDFDRFDQRPFFN